MLSEKKYFFSCFIILMLFYGIHSVSSQKVDSISKPVSKSSVINATRYIRKGDELFYKSKNILLPEALKNYLKAYKSGSSSAMLNYKIGFCYLFGNEKSKSLDFLLAANKADSLIDEKILLYIGISYQHNLQFDKAIEFFDKYYKGLSSESQFKSKAFILKKIDECKNAKEIVKNKIRYKSLIPVQD
jgi:tetratricopeptide (TPR) repeat protein